MRRTVVTTLTALTLAAAPSSGEAQEGTLGLGLGLGSSLLDELQEVFVPSIYVPIVASERIMIEPGVGFARFSTSDDDSETTFSALSIGAGLLFLTPVGSGDRIYWGPRVGIVRLSESFSAPGFDDDESTTNLSIAAVAGGEFFLRSHFGLGGEVGLRWLRFDEEDEDVSSSLLSTTAELRVRWYVGG